MNVFLEDQDGTNRIASMVRGYGAKRIHLAIFREPYLSLLLSGKKTIESRFSISRRAPYKKVDPDDIILLKKTGGPVIAACVAKRVLSFELDQSTLSKIRKRYERRIAVADPHFWRDREKASFATLIFVQNVVRIPKIRLAKRDRRGWVILWERSHDADFDSISGKDRRRKNELIPNSL